MTPTPNTPDEPGRTPPYNLEAEESALGAMLLSRDAIRDVLDVTTQADYYRPAHAEIFGAIGALYFLGRSIDLVTVAAELQRRGKLDQVGGRPMLARLHASVPASANAKHYGALVAEAAMLRRMIGAAGELVEAGYAGDLDAVQNIVATFADRVEVPALPVNVGVDVAVLAAREYPVRWLVPDLLERRDRLVVSGPEGFGKSTLLRQMGLMLAAGIHPFKRTPIAPVRVLMLDCENSEAQSTRAFRWLLKRCASQYRDGQMIVVNRPQGLNLRSRADRRWLDGLLAYHHPDLLVCGPLYKLFEGSQGVRKDSEEAADEVARAFDDLRVRHDVALIIEAHAPHGDAGDRAGYRPYGASLWLRWPEFGIGMVPDGDDAVKLRHWRGARDRDRDWPERLLEGANWPWEAPGEPWVAPDDPSGLFGV